MAFPVLKPQDTRRYPDAKTTVVDWSGFGQKLMQGVVAGIGLSQSIKKSNEESALSAIKIKQTQAAIDAQKTSTALAQEASVRESTRHALIVEQMKAENATKYSATRLATDQLQANRLYGQEVRQAKSLGIMTEHDEAYNDLIINRANLQMQADNQSDPGARQIIVDEMNKETKRWEKRTGLSVTKLATSLPKDDQRAAQLALFDPMLTQTTLMNNMMVPLLSSVRTESEYNPFGPEAMMGTPRQDLTLTKQTIEMVPLATAKQYWLAGMSLSTLEDMQKNTANPEAFARWKTANGLEKIVPGVEPGPVMDEGVSSEIKAIRPGLATERISEQAGRAMRDITIESPLIKSTQSFTQKLREKLTSKEFTLLQAITGNPIGALLSPNMLRGGTEAVQWIAEKTGIGIKAADKLHDKLRDLLPMAGEAEDAFMSDPEKVTAETDHWVERRARLAAELKTATPARKLVINETIGLINEKLSLANPVNAATAGTSATASKTMTEEEFIQWSKDNSKPEPTKEIIDYYKKQGMIVD